MVHGRPRIVVVGCGVVGASVAFHLARAGAAVTVLEAHEHPAMGVTAHSMGWVGHAGSWPRDDDGLFRVRMRAVEAFDRLQADCPGLVRKTCTGALVWSRTPEATQALARAQRAEGVAVRLVSGAGVSQREPGLGNPPDCAAYAEGDFAVEPAALTGAFLRGARDAGAAVFFRRRVMGVETRNGRVVAVRTASSTVRADGVVMAAGMGCAGLARGVGVDLRLEASPCALLRFSVAGSFVRGIVSGPDLEIRHGADGSLMVPESYPGEGKEALSALAGRTAGTIRRHFPGAQGLSLISADVGFRPFPADERPMVGFLPRVDGVYVAVAHPGIILSSFMGRVAADEIVHGKRDAAWSHMQPDQAADRRARGDGGE